VNVGQPSVDPVVVERQTLVVDAQDVQDRGMESCQVDGVLDGLPADFIG